MHSPGSNLGRGESDTTELKDTAVLMEVIARTLQKQLQQERQVLTGEIQRAMGQVNSRVDDVERVSGGPARGRGLAGTQKAKGNGGCG